MMNDKLKAMYAGGGLLKALLKDPKQREMAKGMLNRMEMGGAMKYRMGGNMPGEDEDVPSPYTEIETERIVKDPVNMGFEFANQDYLEQFPEKIEDPAKLFRFFTVKEAARMLEDDNISVAGASPQKILNMARTKGYNPVTSARDLFDREMEIRKGRGSKEFEFDSEFRS